MIPGGVGVGGLRPKGAIHPRLLTGYVEVDQPFVFASFVYGRAFVHDGGAGVANVQLAHDL